MSLTEHVIRARQSCRSGITVWWRRGLLLLRLLMLMMERWDVIIVSPSSACRLYLGHRSTLNTHTHTHARAHAILPFRRHNTSHTDVDSHHPPVMNDYTVIRSSAESRYRDRGKTKLRIDHAEGITAKRTKDNAQLQCNLIMIHVVYMQSIRRPIRLSSVYIINVNIIIKMVRISKHLNTHK